MEQEEELYKQFGDDEIRRIANAVRRIEASIKGGSGIRRTWASPTIDGQWGRITAQHFTNKKRYSWKQVMGQTPGNDPQLDNDSTMMEGSAAGDNFAYEVSGSESVPADPITGAIVYLFPSYTQDYFLFSYARPSGFQALITDRMTGYTSTDYKCSWAKLDYGETGGYSISTTVTGSKSGENWLQDVRMSPYLIPGDIVSVNKAENYPYYICNYSPGVRQATIGSSADILANNFGVARLNSTYIGTINNFPVFNPSNQTAIRNRGIEIAYNHNQARWDVVVENCTA